MKIKNDEAGRLSVTDKVWELSVRASVRVSVRVPVTCLPTGRPSEHLLAFLNAHLTATLRYAYATFLNERLRKQTADSKFACYESAPYGKTQRILFENSLVLTLTGCLAIIFALFRHGHTGNDLTCIVVTIDIR